MNGWIDGGGRALVRITVKAANSAPAAEFEAWIDTGFTADLVLPETIVAELKLPQSGTVGAQLGDGPEVVMNTYTCLIDWFGREQQIEVVANHGQFPLLGVGLLRDYKLTVDYGTNIVAIE